jgi:hypothetical protein
MEEVVEATVESPEFFFVQPLRGGRVRNQQGDWGNP